MRYVGWKTWEETMDSSEIKLCLRQIQNEARRYEDSDNWVTVSGFRAARLWKSSQVRRFKKLEERDPSYYHIRFVAYRWSWKKFRFDKYLLGFSVED